MIREPVVAGQFYPASPTALRTMIAGLTDINALKEEAIGAVLPHAGYIYSGAVAGAVISRLKLKGSIIILGPNHTGKGKPFSIMTQGKWRTPLGEIEIDTEMAGRLLATSKCLEEDHLAHLHEHSIEVQLPFFQYFREDFKLVPIILSFATGAVYQEIGRNIARVIKETGAEALIIASSDMTHYESHERATDKDAQAIEAILKLDEGELLKRVQEIDITMCGYAPAACLITAAKELGATKAELVKYQTSGDASGDYASVVGYAGIIIKEISPLTKLARETVETFVSQRKATSPPDKPTPEMEGRAGVFVSIHKQGELRGCIGTFEPTRKTVAQEVIANAISSATRDPRFPPVAPEELEHLTYSVDVLTSPEPVASQDELDARKYGVIVESGLRRGLLLPNLEGVDSPAQQIEICRLKAGIAPDEPVKLHRFEVKRYH